MPAQGSSITVSLWFLHRPIVMASHWGTKGPPGLAGSAETETRRSCFCSGESFISIEFFKQVSHTLAAPTIDFSSLPEHRES